MRIRTSTCWSTALLLHGRCMGKRSIMGGVNSVLQKATSLDLTDPSSSAIISNKLFEAAQFLSLCPEARTAFIEFLVGEKWISFFVEKTCSGPSAIAAIRCISYCLPSGGNLVVDEKRGRLMARNRPAVASTPRSSTMRTACDLLSLPGMQLLVIAAVLPLYLRSHDFLLFLQSQATGKMLVRSFHHPSCESPVSSLTRTVTVSRSDSDEGPASSSPPSTVMSERTNTDNREEDGDDRLRLRHVLETTVRAMDPTALDTTLSRSELWLAQLLQFLDDMPLCLSVATTTPSTTSSISFPLVFVNQAFEQMTLYPRHVICGQNCRFLQSDKSEVQQIEKLRKALRDHKPVNLAVTNARKDGSSFLNLLAMRPVFNAKGEYTHVIGAQYDLSQQPPEGFTVDLFAVDIILRLLPAVLAC